MSGNLNTSLAGLRRADNALIGAGSRLSSLTGMPLGKSIVGASEMARTAWGEAGAPYKQSDRIAAANTMLNRMAVGMTGAYKPYSAAPSSMEQLLGGFDPTGLEPRTQQYGNVPKGGSAAYRAAQFGTDAYAKGLDALNSALSGAPDLPESVKNASHFYSGKAPSWGQTGFTQFGAHKFGNPDYGPDVVKKAREAIGIGANSSYQPASYQAPPTSGMLKSRVVDGKLQNYVDYGGPPQSLSGIGAPPSGGGWNIPDAASSAAGNVAGAVKSWGSDYLQRAVSPENVAKFARENPGAALRLALARLPSRPMPERRPGAGGRMMPEDAMSEEAIYGGKVKKMRASLNRGRKPQNKPGAWKWISAPNAPWNPGPWGPTQYFGVF